MTVSEILRIRLANQQLSGTHFKTPGEIVKWMGAMQAQDFTAVKWAIASRLPSCTESNMEKAFLDREIIRTWLLRGTLHVTTPADIRWMGSLILPRLMSFYAGNFRRLELDKPILKKSKKILEQGLRGHQQLTRDELKQLLQQKGIQTHDLRMNFILLEATLNGLICFGPKRKKQFTHVLQEEWLPAKAEEKDNDEALAELAKIYFTSHGPALLRDFAWWSGFTQTDCRRAIEINGKQLQRLEIGRETYWMGNDNSLPETGDRRVYLLPAFDEWLVAYADRSLSLNPDFTRKVITPNGIFNPVIIANQKVVATWKKNSVKNKTTINIDRLDSWGAAYYPKIRTAVRHYSKYLGISPEASYL